jgi:hypothetical protein
MDPSSFCLFGEESEKSSQKMEPVPFALTAPMTPNRKYDVALSFAGEDRAYVEMVAEQLTARDVSVFYDKYEGADLWGRDLYEHLTEVYRSMAHFTLMFISVHYKEKLWANHERKAAQARAFLESGEYILPARFDDTEVPGILQTTGYIDLRTRSPAEVALLLCEKLGQKSSSIKADQVPSPKNPSHTGEAAFNYSNYNGRFRIGEGPFEFETRWSKAGDTTIHCYTDGTNLRGIALAPKCAAINGIVKVDFLDFTNRCRTPEVGRIVILENLNGMFAGMQILEIGDDTRGAAEDYLRFKYWILSEGGSDFSGISH